MPDNFIVGNFVADDFIADNFITGDDGWRSVIKVIFISPASADSANPDGRPRGGRPLSAAIARIHATKAAFREAELSYNMIYCGREGG
jgi:hypothetical protein